MRYYSLWRTHAVFGFLCSHICPSPFVVRCHRHFQHFDRIFAPLGAPPSLLRSIILKCNKTCSARWYTCRAQWHPMCVSAPALYLLVPTYLARAPSTLTRRRWMRSNIRYHCEWRMVVCTQPNLIGPANELLFSNGSHCNRLKRKCGFIAKHHKR